MRPISRLAVPLCLGVLIGMSCQFTFRDDLVYSCKTTADCGRGAFVCLAGACCSSSGDEVCGDGVDNDCDGRVDGDEGRVMEVCNGRDDDCDGLFDEGFDLQQSPTHCGACGSSCDLATQRCVSGTCGPRAETDCGNGLDDDQNGQADCADLGCNLIACGTACLCQGGRKVEQVCDDGVDSDADGALDCADPDCANQVCGTGCTCLNGVRRETNCADQVDNDTDGGADCADPGCAGQFCLANSTQRCMGSACLCNGGPVVDEVAALCGDSVDNDCDNLTDCRETACDTQSCSPDGGADCLCAGTTRAERACGNLGDDDGDTLIDCADRTDCPEMSVCTAVLGALTRTGRCGAAGTCAVEFCFDGADNDGDSQVDCVDADCDTLSCQADGGADCQCANARKVEMNCADRADNDGDAQADCADFADCPQGTVCRRNNGQPGVCQSNRTCN